MFKDWFWGIVAVATFSIGGAALCLLIVWLFE
jgi:hypothetical protein